MYELLILAGNHPDQSRWASEVSSSFSSLFSQIWIHQYKHWNDSQLNGIDLSFELEELKSANKISEISVIFGKSAGVILAFMAYYQRIISPSCAILVGTPLHWARKKDMPIDEWLRDVKISALYIQNELDPVCSADELLQALPISSDSKCDLVKLDGSSHDYEDLDLLRETIAIFLDRIN